MFNAAKGKLNTRRVKMRHEEQHDIKKWPTSSDSKRQRLSEKSKEFYFGSQLYLIVAGRILGIYIHQSIMRFCSLVDLSMVEDTLRLSILLLQDPLRIPRLLCQSSQSVP